MPVNPRYNFLNSDAQLGQGAFGAGNALWGGPAPEMPPQPERATPYIPSGITPDVRQAVLMGRQQPVPAAPVAPATPRIRVAPQAPRSQIMEQDLPPEQFAPEAMSPEFDLGTPSSMGRIVEPDHTPARPDFSEYEQTTLAKRGRDMGFDPRQLMVALAEFSAGMGNIKGKPQESTARSFYQMQKQEEGQADASRRADEAQRRQEMMMMLSRQPKAMDPIMQKYYEAQTQAALQRNAPKPDAPVDPLKQKYLEAQIENLNARTRNEQLGSLATQKTPGQPVRLSEKDVKKASTLRHEYQNNPTTKASVDMSRQWSKVQEVMNNPSAAGDMASIFMFMKALDPGSTVREGEYKSAAEATGALGRVQQSLQKAGSGQNLTPQQRSDFKGVMEKFYRAQMKEQAKTDKQYKSLAERSGVDPQDLLLNESGQQPQAVRSINDLPDVR